MAVQRLEAKTISARTNGSTSEGLFVVESKPKWWNLSVAASKGTVWGTGLAVVGCVGGMFAIFRPIVTTGIQTVQAIDANSQKWKDQASFNSTITQQLGEAKGVVSGYVTKTDTLLGRTQTIERDQGSIKMDMHALAAWAAKHP